MQIVRYKDFGHVTQIRCQYPPCKTKPRLRHVFYTDDGKTIGRICAKKIGGSIKELKPHKRKSSIHRRKKHKINSHQLTLIDIFKEMGERGNEV